MNRPLELGAPVETQHWDDQPSYTAIEDIECLNAGRRMKYVRQGDAFDLTVPTQGLVGSDGFGRCCGLVVHDRSSGKYTFAHLEPGSDLPFRHWGGQFQPPSPWSEERDALFVYGSLSARHHELKSMLKEEYWGPIGSVDEITVETGKTHWGLALLPMLGQIAIVRKQPDQTVLYFQVFAT